MPFGYGEGQARGRAAVRKRLADKRFRGCPQTKGCPGRTGRPQEFRKNLLRIRQGVGGNLAASVTRTYLVTINRCTHSGRTAEKARGEPRWKR